MARTECTGAVGTMADPPEEDDLELAETEFESLSERSRLVQDAALRLHELGFVVIPVQPLDKKPPLIRWQEFQDRRPSEDEIRGWWEKWPDANLAVVTGRASGVDVVDVDPGHDQNWPPPGCELDSGFVVTTPRGGKHYFFRHLQGVRGSVSVLANHVDVRADGNYIVVPPSRRTEGEYAIDAGSFSDARREPPAWLRKALREASGPARGTSVDDAEQGGDETIPEGRRNVTLCSLAGSMRRRGMTEPEILAALTVANGNRCRPPLDADDVDRIASWAASKEPGPGAGKNVRVDQGRETPFQPEDVARFLGPHLPPLADELVEGMLRLGCKGAFYGPPKSYKTHAVIQLCVAVATGSPFLGRTTRRGNVCFINPELQRESFLHRVDRIAEELGFRLRPGTFDALHLRGRCVPLDELAEPLITYANRKPGRISLFVFDSCYKIYGDRDENSASDMAAFLNVMDRIARETGAAVVLSHHFAKGNAAAKYAIDRSSGSGVLARDPDTILTLTPHQIDDVFVIDATLRDFPPIQPFCVRQKYPLIRLAPEHDPTHLKSPRASTAPPVTLQNILNAFSNGPMTRDDLVAAVKEGTGRGENAVRQAIRSAVDDGCLVTIRKSRPGVRPQVLLKPNDRER